MTSVESFIDLTALVYNLDFLGAMSFHSVSHLPRLVAKFFVCERK